MEQIVIDIYRRLEFNNNKITGVLYLPTRLYNIIIILSLTVLEYHVLFLSYVHL